MCPFIIFKGMGRWRCKDSNDMMVPSPQLLHKSPPEILNDNLMYWFDKRAVGLRYCLGS